MSDEANPSSKAAATQFADIVALLNVLVPVAIGSHGNFWQNVTRDQFVAKKVFGRILVVPGDVSKSNLFLALAGMPPFDGTGFARMPDVVAVPQARYATPAELQLVGDWITAGAP